MRISDWSSDVCSSDLLVRHRVRISEVFDADGPSALGVGEELHGRLLRHQQRTREVVRLHALAEELGIARGLAVPQDAAGQRLQHGRPRVALRRQPAGEVEAPVADVGDARSEEHTSELQSLMRISYAVFCLKKKKTYKHTIHTS